VCYRSRHNDRASYIRGSSCCLPCHHSSFRCHIGYPIGSVGRPQRRGLGRRDHHYPTCSGTVDSLQRWGFGSSTGSVDSLQSQHLGTSDAGSASTQEGRRQHKDQGQSPTGCDCGSGSADRQCHRQRKVHFHRQVPNHHWLYPSPICIALGRNLPRHSFSKSCCIVCFPPFSSSFLY
jgi:hypothetical protein